MLYFNQKFYLCSFKFGFFWSILSFDGLPASRQDDLVCFERGVLSDQGAVHKSLALQESLESIEDMGLVVVPSERIVLPVGAANTKAAGCKLRPSYLELLLAMISVGCCGRRWPWWWWRGGRST